MKFSRRLHDGNINVTYLKINTKHIPVVIFSLLVHQMYVFDTKTLVIAYSFILEKRPMNVLKMSKSDTCSMTYLGRPQDVNLIVFRKKRFLRKFFLYLRMPRAYQTLQNQNKLKI